MESQATSVASTQQESLADEIAKLDELRRQGVLTEAEFQAKKTRLLNEG